MSNETGPVSAAVRRRPPVGPIERLDHERLVEEHRRSLASPRRDYSRSARILFALVDRVYGANPSLEKFRVLELVARMPYQAWEHIAYVGVTHTARRTGLARHIFDRVRAARFEQDNEQWHLLIMEELTAGTDRPLVRTRVVPKVLAFAYFHLSWMLFVVRPVWSYRLNADLEDHAEHEYACYVDEHPELADQPYEGRFTEDFGRFASLADLFRQIGYDERLHKLESERNIAAPRLDD